MRYSVMLLPLAALGLAGCVVSTPAPRPTNTTIITPAPTTTYAAPPATVYVAPTDTTTTTTRRTY